MPDLAEEPASEPSTEPQAAPVKKKRSNPRAKTLNLHGRKGNPEEITRLRIRVKELEGQVAGFEEKERLAALEIDDAEGGVVTSARMWKVFGQHPSKDVGPTEARLRVWLERDTKGFEARARALEENEQAVAKVRADNAALKERVAELERKLAERQDEEGDAGAERADAQLEKLLAFYGGRS